VRQAEKFRELGAQVKNPISPQLLQDLDDDDALNDQLDDDPDSRDLGGAENS
jgi:hypothetical protein